MKSVLVAVALLASGSALAESSNFDGTYRGQMANVWNPNAPAHGGVPCDGTYPRTITVRGGAFDINYNKALFQVVHATIDANGAVSGFTTTSGGGVTLKGQVSGGVLNATIGSSACDYTLRLIKG